jgi:hypothetical protein
VGLCTTCWMVECWEVETFVLEEEDCVEYGKSEGEGGYHGRVVVVCCVVVGVEEWCG